MVSALIFAGSAALVLFLLWQGLKLRKKGGNYKLPVNAAELLQTHVAFYRTLDAAQRKAFEGRLLDFLSTTSVTGVGVTVTDLDRLLVAASAIIPIAAFPDWRYNNISEVLLYPDTFSKEYALEGEGRNVLGMVGNGAMNGQMILSQHALRDGFAREDGHNTGIHEFVHLIDKADGATDGVPEYLLAQPYIVPWIERMHREIGNMRAKDGDINPYGATNDAEFFAVLGEYFFERPEALQERHPELYSLLCRMFHPVPNSES